MVHVGPVISGRAHARILSVNTAEALKYPGVLGYIDRKDIPETGINACGGFMDPDETVFAVDEVK